MSLKQEIETWVAALACYDNHDFDDALKVFAQIPDTSKILFNCGVIHATLGEHERAVDCYQRAVRLDQYLAIAYFQQGVSNFLMGDFEEALANFNDTLLYLRGNSYIDYEQLGLKFKLFSCEVLFNRGLCYIYLQQKEAGLQDLAIAAKEKAVPDHDVIDEAISEEAEGYTVFSIPVGILYRPHESKVRNLKTKDYLGRARLISASDRSNITTGSNAVESKKVVLQTTKDDRLDEKLFYAAANLAKPETQNRARQQSEPPLNRNMFPPTPPPEADRKSAGKSDVQVTRAQSIRSGGSTSQPLNLVRTALNQQQERTQPASRRVPRSESARPSERQVERTPLTRAESTRARHREYRPRRRGSNDPDHYYSGDGHERPIHFSRGVYAHPKPINRPEYIEEEEEDDDDYDGSDLDEAEFEMISRAKSRRRSPARSTRSGGNNRSVGGKIRVKCHAADTRYVFTTPETTIREFWQLIREKFGIRGNFKVEIQDDGDMITMADQDDLDMAVQSARDMAKKDGSDMAKMEVWIRDV